MTLKVSRRRVVNYTTRVVNDMSVIYRIEEIEAVYNNSGVVQALLKFIDLNVTTEFK